MKGLATSSVPMLIRFFSPPEIPRRVTSPMKLCATLPRSARGRCAVQLRAVQQKEVSANNQPGG